MAATMIKSVAWFCLAGAVAAGGYFAGSRHGHLTTIKALQTEAAANLTQRIEALSLLRTGDVQTAIMRLEEEADQLTLSIASNEGADRRVLASAKAYRSVVPPPPARESQLSAVFLTLPTLDPSQCSSALRRLLLSAHSGPTSQN